MDAYAGNPDVGFVGIDYGVGNSRSVVEAWIDNYGWTFPVGINDDENEIYRSYGFATGGYDTFFVIDRAGKITLIEGYGNSTADFPRIVGAIEAALAPVPVRAATWGRIKGLYR